MKTNQGKCPGINFILRMYAGREDLQQMLSGAGYDPQIDLVVAAPEGTFALCCMCWINRDKNLRSG